MNRADQLARLSGEREEWDLIVIGGGATGLAIALDAATRGYGTLLLEGADFAESTSSKSTKLIHGGVRYLRGGEVGLVREALVERGRLLENAPCLVRPLAFVVPAYRWYDRGYYGAGLRLYDVMAGKRGIRPTESLSTRETLEACPNLLERKLRGGVRYWDAQFDDSRLAVAMARTASANGALVLNHVRVTDLVKNGGRVSGAVARDRFSGAEIRVRGKVVINATGVFTDSVRKMDEPEAENVIAPSQGVHIVLDSDFLGSDTGIMIPKTADGRVLFAIPWKNRIVIGTTDTAGVPVELNPKPLREEVDYLVEHAAEFLSRAPGREDIRATFAGLRPLVLPGGDGSGKSSDISRKHCLMVSRSGLVTMTGGKWTTCRAMAEAAVDRAGEIAALPRRECRTAHLRLLDESTAPEIERTERHLGEALDGSLPYTMADVAAAVRDEQAETLDDVLSRRTRCRFLDEEASVRCAAKVARFMAREKGEEEDWVRKEIESFKNNFENLKFLEE